MDASSFKPWPSLVGVVAAIRDGAEAPNGAEDADPV